MASYVAPKPKPFVPPPREVSSDQHANAPAEEPYESDVARRIRLQTELDKLDALIASKERPETEVDYAQQNAFDVRPLPEGHPAARQSSWMPGSGRRINVPVDTAELRLRAEAQPRPSGVDPPL